MADASRKLCFVISPIGEEGSGIREKADEVFMYVIKPVLEPLGYDVIRADKIDESGIITTQIIQKLIDADIVVADLSEKNPNVFYELSVRHASRKPFVQLITAGEIIPFDVAANRTIQYDLGRLAVVEAAKEQLKAQVEAINAGRSDIENPISNAIDLSALRMSASSSDRTLGEILASLTDVGATVAKLDRVVSENDPRRASRDREEIRRLRAFLSQARGEVSRLRVIKGKVEFDSVSNPRELEKVLDAIGPIVSHIREYCLPMFDVTEEEREKILSVLSDIHDKIVSLSMDIALGL